MTDSTQLLEGLTDAQRAAVEHGEGPLLVLAGPGSGKTTVVTRRIARLIAAGVRPWQILALTFTNKAAGEMRQRVEALLPADPAWQRGLTVATFHSFAARLLRRYAADAGIASHYTIYDSADQREAIKRAIAESDLSTRNFSPAAVAGSISNAKNALQDAERFAAQAGDFHSRTIAKVYRCYEKILRKNHALDFDDLLLVTATLLQTNESIRDELQSRFQYLLIDEYQDTNHAQFVIADELASAHQNICVVGDPDQSIYGWRGADIRNILEFEKNYPEARVIDLGQNFRSTGHIVDAAAGLIEHNEHRKPKRLFTELDAGARPTCVVCGDEHDEAALIADEFRRRRDEDDLPWCEMAVLYRVNALSRVLEASFRSAQIPYVIARGTAFYERKEIKDALSYLRVLANPSDEVALRRIVNTPTRGIGKTTLARLDALAARESSDLLDAMRNAASIDDLSTRASNACTRFVAMFDDWRKEAEEAAGHGVGEEPSAALAMLVDRVIRESGLDSMYRLAKNEEDRDRVENLAELVSAAAEYTLVDDEEAEEEETVAVTGLTRLRMLQGFLESVALVSDSDALDPTAGAVTLMTLHTAKGLEFDVVAIAGLEQGLLPHARAMEHALEIEEERRLCFVGMTRARRHLLLTRAQSRTHRGLRERTIPSIFLDELPAASVTTSDQAGEPDDWPGMGAGSASLAGDFPVGCLVRHRKFGMGRVESIMPRPVGASARVHFDGVGTKTLILEYANLQRVR